VSDMNGAVMASENSNIEIAAVEINTPRDRDGSFEPKTVRKRQRRLRGVDDRKRLDDHLADGQGSHDW